MQRQLPLFSDLFEGKRLPRPVNVASVPQRSPFRYPGGKTWFVPTFRGWMASLKSRPRVLVEPFAGGGIISLTALFENWVEMAVMVELDDEVASVWETIVNGDAEWLANRILTFPMTRENVEEELQQVPRTRREQAFQTILKNRTLHGGILAKGSRFIKHGENGKGIGSRWYPSTLAQRIINLNHIVSRIDFRHDDGLKVMGEFARREDVVYFVDPPYTAGGKQAGRRLYKHYQVDHSRLFTICKSLSGDFLMTYEDSEEIREMVRKHRFQMCLIPMRNTHHATLMELVIGRDLSWLGELPIVRELGTKYKV